MTDTLVLTGSLLCGFCNDGHHDRCPHAIENNVTKENPPRRRIWLCPCEEPDCGGTILSCVNCKKVHDDVDPATRLCMDQDACAARIEARRANNPLYQQVHEIQEKHRMAKEQTKTEKAPAKPKVGTCKCGCEGETKGGNFLPGHDARLVSRLVNEVVVDKSTTEANARKTMAPFSDALKGKFEKQIGIAKDKAAKRVEAEKAKKAAKAEAEKAKSAKAEKAPANA